MSGDASAYESSGGGVWCASSSGDTIVSNCVMTRNSGVIGSAAYKGFLSGCLVISNSVGPAVYQSFATNCLLLGNSGISYGGGAANSQLINCTLMQNVASYGGGARSSSLAGCLVVNNRAFQTGGGIDNPISLVNCTVVSNSAGQGGGVSGGSSPMYNNIIYFNSASLNSNTFSGTYFYSCMPVVQLVLGNITNEPFFINPSVGDYRLQPSSPCINAARNSSVTTTGTDLDGNPRIVSGTVDMGAYEFQGTGSLISYAWLQQYGLTTDGSSDYVDSDGDGLNNWKEWVAGTEPTNTLSVLLTLSPKSVASGVSVSWQSVSTRSYYIERTTNIALTSFQTLVSTIFGQDGTTSYTDTKATNFGPYFYRVGVNGP